MEETMDSCHINVVLSQEHFILSQAKNTLWCDRRDGRLTAGTGLHRDSASDYTDLGQVWGVIGKLRFFTDGDWKLIVITQASLVGSLPQGGRVFCVDKIGILPLTVQFDLSTEIVGFETRVVSEVSQSLARPSSPTAVRLTRGSVGPADKEKVKSKEVREREKVEKRLTEALLGMFNDSQSFYFSLDCDLTLTFQGKVELSKDLKHLPFWKQVDERFFWNKCMIGELLDKENNAPALAAPWILPVIQGYVEVRQIPVLLENTPTILQPGWSKQYREEREKSEQEYVMAPTKQRAISVNAPEEVEMKEMASFDMDRLSIPLVKKIGGSSGYDYESDSENYSDDESARFSPLQFTNVIEKGSWDVKQAVFVGSAENAEKKDGGVVEGEGRARMSNDANTLADKGVGDKELGAQSDCGYGGGEHGDGGGGHGDGGGEHGDGDVEHGDGEHGDGSERGDGGGNHGDGEHVDGEHGDGDGEHGDGGSEHGDGGDDSCESQYAKNRSPSVPSPSLNMSGKRLEPLAPETSGQTFGHPGGAPDPSGQTVVSLGQPLHRREKTGRTPPKCTDRKEKLSSQDSKSKFYAALDGNDVCLSEEEFEEEGCVGGTLEQQKSNFYVRLTEDQAEPDDTLGLDREKEGEEEGNNTDDKSLSGSQQISPTKYYTSQDIPDVDGVMINLLELGNEDSSAGVNRNLLFSMEEMKTRGEVSSNPTPEEFPVDLSRDSPMGNPFLGKQRSPSWVHHMQGGEKGEDPPTFTLAIISRRSCKRAGTRYRRRGVNFDGHVANYVETELVLKCGSHMVSYVIVRGSVPMYWSQPGYKYRPLPVIEKTVEETQKAFQKHFDQLFSLFNEIVVVNLVKQTGREKLVGDAFEQHVLLLNSPLLTYVTFDFHQSYKANQGLALQKLREGTAEFIKTFKFCWVDTDQSGGPLCKQEGAFRVNCMDCLDRTNVVESLFSREVLQTALQKLGVLPFEEALGGSTLISYQEMWANNGDIISKQYAGTAAMKGDITRYGERKISGMMKDGYNSAHRYYINIFRDSYRQVLIDLMQGVNPFEAFLSLPRSLQGMDELEDNCLTSSLHQDQPVREDAWSLDKEETVIEMVGQCQEELFPHHSSSDDLCSWMLMEPAGQGFVTDNKEDEPCVAIHSRKRETLSIAKFDMAAKRVVCFLQIEMSQIERIVVGQLAIHLRNRKHFHMRIYYSLMESTSCYLTFTTSNMVSIREERAILLSIAEFLASMQPSMLIQEQTINRKRSPPHQGIIYLVPPNNDDGVCINPASHLAATYMESSRSHDSITTTPSVDLEEMDGLINRGQQVGEEDVETSLSVPSSPKIKRSLHRRQQSQSLDDITIEDVSELRPPQRGPAIRVCSPSKDEGNEVMFFKGIGSDESGSDSELDLFDVVEESRRSRMPSKVKNPSDIPLLDVVYNSKESEDEDESRGRGGGSGEGWGGGKLSKLKGRLLMKVKSSRNSFMPRPHSPGSDFTSTTDHTSAKKNTSPGAPADVHKGDATIPSSAGGSGGDAGAAQWVGAVKQRFRVNSPAIWSKIRKTSPSAPPESGEEDLVKLEESRKRSKSRLVFI